MTSIQKLKTLAVPMLLLNIILPIFDVFSDLRLIVLLFLGGFSCWDWKHSDDYISCKKNPIRYCTNITSNPAVCEETHYGFKCNDHVLHNNFNSCLSDPTSYCTNTTANHDVCEYVSLPLYAIMLLVPFLLNYAMSFFTWWRLNNNKKFSFIFALLNVYAFGKSLSLIFL